MQALADWSALPGDDLHAAASRLTGARLEIASGRTTLARRSALLGWNSPYSICPIVCLPVRLGDTSRKALPLADAIH